MRESKFWISARKFAEDYSTQYADDNMGPESNVPNDKVKKICRKIMLVMTSLRNFYNYLTIRFNGNTTAVG